LWGAVRGRVLGSHLEKSGGDAKKKKNQNHEGKKKKKRRLTSTDLVLWAPRKPRGRNKQKKDTAKATYMSPMATLGKAKGGVKGRQTFVGEKRYVNQLSGLRRDGQREPPRWKSGGIYVIFD